MCELYFVDKDGNRTQEGIVEEILGDDNTVLLTADRMERFTPPKIESLFAIPIAKQRIGYHIVSTGKNLAKEMETTLNEFVRPQMRIKLANLVTVTERCRSVQENHPAETVIAKTARTSCHHDIRHIAREISRYITQDYLLTIGQRTDATLARDLLMAAINALEDKRFAGAVARVKEAQKAFSEIRNSDIAERCAE